MGREGGGDRAGNEDWAVEGQSRTRGADRAGSEEFVLGCMRHPVKMSTAKVG